MEVIVSGSHGLIGSALLPALAAAGHRPIRLVRPPTGGSVAGDSIAWDPAAGTIDAASLQGVDAVINLAGAGIGAHRWTDAYKAEIRGSRVNSTRLLAETIARLDRPPAVLLSGSAVGWYGDRGDELLDEASTSGRGFLADLCLAWEAATGPAEAAGIRTVHLRSGVVLSLAGGALAKQLPLFRLGLGGRFGSGTAWQSWISLPDEVGAIMHLLGVDVSGPVNVTAPQPVTGATFAKTLGAVLHRPAILPVPALAPRLVLGRELADTLLFTGQRVLPKRLGTSGYQFMHLSLASALAELLDRPEP